MKNLIIGLVVGSLLTIGISKVFFNSTDSEKTTSGAIQVLDKVTADAKEIEPIENVESSEISKQALTQLAETPETIEEYQAYTSKLLDEISAKTGVINELKVENKNLERNLYEVQKAVLNRTNDKVSESDLGIARENMQASLADASPEYAEVLQSAINKFESDKEGNITTYPESEALLKHYSEEPDFAWADVAKAYIQNYFASQVDSNIQLVQLNCRKTYCEIYGFYSFGDELSDPRQVAGNVQKTFKAMQQAPGYSNLFTAVTSSSINIDSENSYITFHNFLRSNRK